MFGRTKFGLTVLASFMAGGWVDYNGLYTSISVIIFPQLPDKVRRYGRCGLLEASGWDTWGYHLGLFSLA